MDLFFTVDARFAPHLAVMLYGLLRLEQDSPEPLNLHAVIDAPARSAELAQEVAARFGRPLRLLPAPTAAQTLHAASAFPPRSPTTFFRLFAADLMPELDRVLYLDSDLLIRRTLRPLWRMELGDASLAATDCHAAVKRPELMRRFGRRYFNGGVLLLNLAEWRRREIGRRAVEHALAEPEAVTFHDQCILNHLCPDWRRVEVGWNYSHQLGARHAPLIGMTPAEFEAAGQDPAVFHFLGPKKAFHHPREGASGFVAEYWALRADFEAEFGVRLAA